MWGWLAAGATPLSVVCTVWQLGWTERLNLWRERFLPIPKKAKCLGEDLNRALWPTDKDRSRDSRCTPDLDSGNGIDDRKAL
jgi:hypothetical protein